MVLSMKHCTVLIVDDSRISRRITSTILRSLGADYIEAKDGLEAVELAEKSNFTAVFMNLYLPGINGFEATKRIRKSNPKIPIFAITTDKLDDMTQEMKKAGFTDFLQKPFDKDSLLELLKTYNTKEESIPVFDVKKYKSVYPDVELQRDILQTFLDEKDADSKRLEKAFKTKDKDEIYAAIHYMKGSFSYLKASKILVITQSILDELKKGNVNYALKNKDIFLSDYKELVKELEKYEFE